MRTLLLPLLLCSGCFNYNKLSAGLIAASPDMADENADASGQDGALAADGGTADGALPTPDGALVADMPPSYPESCLDVKTANASAVDGTFTLYVAKNPAKPWAAFCKDMAMASPKEYLTLVNTGTNQNFSQYTAGGYASGTSVRTSYTRIRLDPTLLTVDVSDQTYSTSTGSLTQATTVTSMPYGVAMDCTNASLTGVGNVDLRGTPFTAAMSAFVAGGFYPVGAATYAGSDQIVTLTGGGGCGWVAAGAYASGSPVNVAGGFQLQLVYP